MMADFSCPTCRGTRLERYGKTAAGLQKHRCLVPGCRRQFVGGSDHLIDRGTRAIAENLLLEGISPAKVAKALEGKISARWIYELARRMKQNATAARDLRSRPLEKEAE
jgi:transposase-like protein